MRILKAALVANGVFSLLSGGASALFAETIASSMVVPTPVVRILGVGVFLFGALVLQVGLAKVVRLERAIWVVVLDALWVIGAVSVSLVPGLIVNPWPLLLVTVGVASLAVWQSAGIIRSTVDKPMRITTQIDIDSSPEAVWSHLVDFASYERWNPFIVDASGEYVAGSRLRLDMSNGGRTRQFAPTVVESRPGRTLEWLGVAGHGSLFTGRHRFDVSSSGSGARLVQSEEFSGLMVPLLWRMLDTNTRAGFEAMNRALKERAERSGRHVG